MALTPQNQDAFFREVDDELRREQMVGFWRRYGKTVAAGMVVFLVALAVLLVWQRMRAQAVARDSEALTKGLDALSQRDTTAADAALAPLGVGSRKSYAALARLALASAAAAKGEPSAGKSFRGIAEASDLPVPLRDAATLRYVAANFETLPPAEVVARLKPLAIAGEPWFGSAGEMTVFALIKLGRTAEAGRLLATLTRTDLVPDTIRGRAARMAATLGVDAAPPAASTARNPAR